MKIISEPDGFTGEFYKAFKEIILAFYEFLSNDEKKGTFLFLILLIKAEKYFINTGHANINMQNFCNSNLKIYKKGNMFIIK